MADIYSVGTLYGRIAAEGTLSGNVNAPDEVGLNGATFLPSVSEDGVISWTNDRGLNNPDPVNIKGPVGATGAQGP